MARLFQLPAKMVGKAAMAAQSLFAANLCSVRSKSTTYRIRSFLPKYLIQQFLKVSLKRLAAQFALIKQAPRVMGLRLGSAQNLLQLASDQLAFGNSKPWKSVLSFNVIVLLDGEPNGGEKAGWRNLRPTAKLRFSLRSFRKMSSKKFTTRN